MHDEGKAMTMVDHNESVLGDNPTDEDKLGFTEPAARLADKIARFPADTPMVVGVEGKWGEGKSSFLLMMKKHWREQACLAPTGFWKKLCQFFQPKGFCARLRQFFQEKELREKPARQIKLIEFDPWWFSGKENLLDKLLKELEGQEPWWRLRLRGLLKSLEKQANTENKWVNGGVNAMALGLASGASAILNPILDWLDGDLLISIKSWLQDGRAKAALVLALFWVIQWLLKQFIAWLSPPEGFEARKKKLEELLKKDRFQRVVFIDDLDRLPVDELQEMFRVIKSVANFPNVVYVLAYDREVVSTGLDKFHPGRGELFLEKIVQMPVALPVPTQYVQDRVYRQIFSDLPAMQAILKEPIDPHSQIEHGWKLICSGFIKNIRQAKRLRDTMRTCYNEEIQIPPLFFLFLESLRLHSTQACNSLCRAMENYADYPQDAKQINWLEMSNQGNDKYASNMKEYQTQWMTAQGLSDELFTTMSSAERKCIAFFADLSPLSVNFLDQKAFRLLVIETTQLDQKNEIEKEERSRLFRCYLQNKLGEDVFSTRQVEFMLNKLGCENELLAFIDAHISALSQPNYLVRELVVYLINSTEVQVKLWSKAYALGQLVAKVAEGFYLQPENDKNASDLYFCQKIFRGLLFYFYVSPLSVSASHSPRLLKQEILSHSPMFLLQTSLKNMTSDNRPVLESILKKISIP